MLAATNLLSGLKTVSHTDLKPPSADNRYSNRPSFRSQRKMHSAIPVAGRQSQISATNRPSGEKLTPRSPLPRFTPQTEGVFCQSNLPDSASQAQTRPSAQLFVI